MACHAEVMLRKIIRGINSLVTWITAMALLVCGLYAAYSLWDNQQVYNAAQNVQDDMIRLKPKIVKTDEQVAETVDVFAELQKINPDVCAWLTMENTHVDYPVLQGSNNMIYINTDVYGQFSMAGSIFLDTRCSRLYDEPYMLVHGHHMAQSKMFGDLDLYKDEDFFNESIWGTLMLPQGDYRLETFAYMLVDSYDPYIFEPDRWETDVTGLLDYVESESVFLRAEVLEEVRASHRDTPEAPLRMVTLATCSSEFDNARTIIFTVMRGAEK